MLCSLPEAVSRSELDVGVETRLLGRAAHAGVDVPAGLVLLRQAEQTFYLTNNLPERIRAIFAPLNLRRLDEEAFEQACERAAALVRECVLLDDLTYMLHLAAHNAGVTGLAHWRRPGAGAAEAASGRAGSLLVSLKRLWAGDWEVDTTLERFEATGAIGLEPRPALLLDGMVGERDTVLSSRVGALLGIPGVAFTSAGRLTAFLPPSSA